MAVMAKILKQRFRLIFVLPHFRFTRNHAQNSPELLPLNLFIYLGFIAHVKVLKVCRTPDPTAC